MTVRIFSVPYDSGHRDERMGAGPRRFLAAGLAERLAERGHAVSVRPIEARASFATEIGTAFELARTLAEGVRVAAREGAFPLVLSGNCNSALGAIAGLSDTPLGVVWCDAHGDFNTPDTTASGFLDGMALATLVGRCWRTLAARIPAFAVVPEERVVHVGGRDFDTEERRLLDGSQIVRVSPRAIRDHGVRAAILPVLSDLQERCTRVYLHVDLDVLDPDEAPANSYPAPGGLHVHELTELASELARTRALCGVGLAAYDPACDPEGRALQAGLHLVRTLFA
jgi:arginase